MEINEEGEKKHKRLTYTSFASWPERLLVSDKKKRERKRERGR